MSADQEHEIDTKLFHERLERVYSHWKKQRQFKNFDAFVVAVGRLPKDEIYFKSTAFQLYLFSYELPDLIIVFLENEVIFLSTKKKIALLKQILENKPEECPALTFMIKKNDDNTENFESVWKSMTGSMEGKKFGFVGKDEKSFSGKFFDEYMKFMKEKLESDESLEKLDISSALGSLMSVKESAELIVIKRAATLSTELMENYFRSEMETIINDDKTESNSRLSVKCEEILEDPKKHKVKTNIKADFVDSAYTPVVQSYAKDAPDNDDLKFGVITCALGARYRNYCSNISRTYLVDPSPTVEGHYKLLHKIRNDLLRKLVPSAELHELYDRAVKIIQNSEYPDLVNNLGRSVGFGMGIEFKESSLMLNAKNKKTAQAGMVFNLAITFKDIESEGFKYSLSLADTVVVREGESQCLTDKCECKLGEISYTLSGEKEEDKENEVKLEKNEKKKSSVIFESRTRQEDKIGVLTEEEKRKKKQEEISKKLHDEAILRLANASNEDEVKKVNLKNVTAYKQRNQLSMDPNVRRSKIFLDSNKMALILPIFGQAVPFHIGMIKSITLSQQTSESTSQTLRINFNAPGATLGTNPLFRVAPPDSAFIKDLVYTSTQPKRFSQIHTQVKELQSKYRLAENRRKELEGLVKQGELVLSKSKNNPRLNSLNVRPHFIRGKASGVLEAHLNGFRYICKNQKLDILYENIRYAFFQPSKNELIVLIHFHLKDPIMAPYTKKQKEITFFIEAVDAAQDLGGKSHSSYGDRDELEAEARERKLKSQLDKAFKNFTEKIDNVTFEQPIRNLGFYGVPGKSNVFLMPTADCLVALTEQPVSVFPLEDVEVVHFERVTMSGKNFDLVLINKNYKTWDRITAIPINYLDTVKDWLNHRGLKYYEMKTSINWDAILKGIAQDPKQFFDDGGWDNLEQSEEEESEEEEDEYMPSEEDTESDDYSDDDSEYSDSGGSEGSEEDSGEDWDALDAKAKAEDRRRFDQDSDDSDRTSKKRSKSSSSKGSSKRRKR